MRAIATLLAATFCGSSAKLANLALPEQVAPVVFPSTQVPVSFSLKNTLTEEALAAYSTGIQDAILAFNIGSCPETSQLDTFMSLQQVADTVDKFVHLTVPSTVTDGMEATIGAYHKVWGNVTRMGNDSDTVLLDPSDCGGVTWELIGSINVTVQHDPDSEMLGGGAGNMLWVGDYDVSDEEIDNIIHIEGADDRTLYVGTRVAYNKPDCKESPFEKVTDFTLETWVSLKAYRPGREKFCCWTALSSVTSDTDNADKLWLGFADKGVVEFQTPSGLTGECNSHRTEQALGNFLPPWGTAVHIAGVYNSTANTKSVYVNGVLQKVWQCTGSLGKLNIPRLSLGLGRISYLDGFLDEVRVWKKARTAEQIQHTKNRHLFPHELKDLIMYYDMDTPTTDGVLYDRSLNGYHIQMGTIDDPKIAQGAISRRYGKFFPSTHPIQASPIEVETYSSPIGPSPLKEIPLFEHANKSLSTRPAADQANQIKLISLPMSNAAKLFVDEVEVTNVPYIIQQGSKLKVQAASGYSGKTKFTYQTQTSLSSSTSMESTVFVTVVANRVPMPGSPGQMMYCDGVDDFAFAKNFTLEAHNGVNGEFGSPGYTVEFWLLHTTGPQNRPALFTMGQGEVFGNWCGDPSQSEEKWYCIGRSNVWMGRNAVVQLNWQPSTSGGGVAGSIMDTWTSWTHYAIVVPGVDLPPEEDNSVALKFYRNGEIFKEGVNHWSIRDINGFHMCTFPLYTTTDFHYGGFIDEFRIYDHSRTQEQILQDMHTVPNASERETMHLYFDFNDVERENLDEVTKYPRPEESFDYDFEEVIVAKDKSGKENHLIFAGCTPATEPYCLPGASCGDITVVPKQPCYNTADEQEFLDGARPMLVRSTVPAIGGFVSAMYTVESTPITIRLYGTDADVSYNGDQSISVVVSALPTHGNIYNFDPISYSFAKNSTALSGLTALVVGDTIPDGNVVYMPNENVGGVNVDSFKYRVTDGINTSHDEGTVLVSIRCQKGRYRTENRCVDTKKGSYMPEPSFSEESLPCPAGLHQPLQGMTDCIPCPKFTYQPLEGQDLCLKCLEFPDGNACPDPGHVQSGAAISAILFLLCAYAVIFGILMFGFRNHRAVHAASPLVMVVTSIGSCVFGAGGILFTMNQGSESLCLSKHALVNIGFHLFFTLTVAKGYRMDKIFNNIMFKRIKVSDMKVFSLGIVPAALDALIILVWHLMAPFRLRSEAEQVCVSDKSQVFLGLLGATKVVALIWGVVISYRTRNVPSQFFNHKSVYFLSYNTALALLIASICIITLTDILGASISATITSCALTYTLGSSVIVIFTPILYALLVAKQSSFSSVGRKIAPNASRNKQTGGFGDSAPNTCDETDATIGDGTTTAGNTVEVAEVQTSLPVNKKLKENAKQIQSRITRMKRDLKKFEAEYNALQQKIFLNEAENEFARKGA